MKRVIEDRKELDRWVHLVLMEYKVRVKNDYWFLLTPLMLSLERLNFRRFFEFVRLAKEKLTELRNF